MNKRLIFIYGLIFIISTITFAQKRAFTIDDLYKVKNVSSPVLSNSGEKIAFTVAEFDLPKGKSYNSIYLMDTQGSSLKDISEKFTRSILSSLVIQ